MVASNSKLKLKLKLLIDRRTQRVVFAEANKDFVDFLCSLTTLPLASVVKLLAKNGMIGGMGDLCDSIGSLDRKYIKSAQNMDYILNPGPPVVAFQSPLLLCNNQHSRRKAYMCLNRKPRPNAKNVFDDEINYHPRVSHHPNTKCPCCREIMRCELEIVDSDYDPSAASSVGFVKGAATYMVMDNLEVKPLSIRACIALASSFNIHDLSSLQEKIVKVGVCEGLRLLQMSLQSKNVLTSVFL